MINPQVKIEIKIHFNIIFQSVPPSEFHPFRFTNERFSIRYIKIKVQGSLILPAVLHGYET